MVLSALFSLRLAGAAPANPVVFVTQPPWPYDFTTVNATFGSHLGNMSAAPRGGDLYIRYTNGTLKNLTQAAGYGQTGLQGASAIAVRDPSVHWDGTKVVFSMVVGAPTAQYQVDTYYWQLYEVTGLGSSDTPVITKVPNQPESFNNVSPTYGTDDRIIFTSDRPRDGSLHLYPQRDEYESSPTNTGLWSLDPTTGDLRHLDHSPSGDFNPFVDSFGRVIFTRWDHLQRDQQNRCSNPGFAAFNYSSEAADAEVLDDDTELFPEARADCDADAEDNIARHTLNHFLPWQIHESGEEMETLNHVGRHELVDYIKGSFTDDPNIVEYYGQYSRHNPNSIENFFQIAEDPATAGRYYGVNAPEFGTHASGQIFYVDADPTLPADQMEVAYVTHPDTANTDQTPSSDHIGLSRDPLPLTVGGLVAAHSVSTLEDTNIGTSTAPASRYAYRLKVFTPSGGYLIPGAPLTSGISKTVSFWSPDQLVTFNNVTMWELQPKELVARTRPTARTTELPAPEQAVFDAAGVSVASLRSFLEENDLALLISRNVTKRDELDRQQPVNLRIPSGVETTPQSGKVYDVTHMQFFEGQQVRGYDGREGRRVLAQLMTAIAANPVDPGSPASSVALGADGSMAAFVPAGRAISYQLTDADGLPVVRERFWLTFRKGEIRVCSSCHGVNSRDHEGNAGPTNEPEALRTLLQTWEEGPPQGSEFTLDVRATKNLPNPRKVTAGQKLRISIDGTVSGAATTLSIHARVGANECGEISQVVTDDAGNYTRIVKAPKVSRRMKIRFSIEESGTEKASSMLTVKAKGSMKKRTSAAAVCEKLQLW